MSSRLAPEATHSRTISTLIRVPLIQGLPPRIAELETMRVNIVLVLHCNYNRQCSVATNSVSRKDPTGRVRRYCPRQGHERDRPRNGLGPRKPLQSAFAR